MARLITKFKYLKPNARQGVGGYVKYIATREGVEKIDESFRFAPSSVKQKQLIKRILKDFPDSKDMHEYEDYKKVPNMGNASEFISRALEDNAQAVVGKKTYADYIATRPRAERFGSHGLFTDDGVEVKLDKVSEELNNHNGNVWTVILSLRREDAERLGYDNGKRWRDMLRIQTQTLAENLKIPMKNLRWYAAFHNESHHPHVHLIAYSVIENEGYLTEKGVHNLRSAFARDIFAQDLISVYEKQTEYRDELRKESREKIAEIINKINNEDFVNPLVEAKLKELSVRLSKTKGKKIYGYLKSDVKAIVNGIVDEIAKDERIGKLYELWYEQREEVIRTYTQELPQRLPLSQNTEFKSIRNAVIQEAMNLLTNKETEDETENIQEPTLTFNELEKLQLSNRKTTWDLYKWAKELLNKDSTDYNPNRAVGLLKASAKRGNAVAEYQLGKIYLFGKDVQRDKEKAMQYLLSAAELGNEKAAELLLQIKTEKEKFGNYLVSLGVCRLFQAVLRTMREKLEEVYRGKPAFTDKKLWRKKEEKRQAQGLKHG